jgi:basic membrane lipoprotein Med (substrate-binding protein (PBP1-ABC) superfamily)
LAFAGLVPETAAAQDKMRVAAIFSTPIEEPLGQPDPYGAAEGGKGARVEYKWAEHVSSADYQRVLREFARDGYPLIMGDAFAAEDVARRVAKEFPETAFVFGSGQGPAEPNFSVFDNWIHEPAYLSGLIAGRMTKSNVIGTVAAMDIPEVARLTMRSARRQGEQSGREVQGHLYRLVLRPPKAKEAALAQIAAGVDVVYAERFGVIEAAQEKGILAISNMSDQSQLAPETVITGPVWDMWPTVENAIKQVQAGVYTAQDFGTFSYMSKGGATLAPMHAWETKLPADVMQLVKDKQAAILAGQFRVPVNESTPVSE